MRMLIAFLFLSLVSYSQDNEILVVGNYTSLCLTDSTYIKTDSLPESLDSVKIIMLFSSSTSNFSDSDIDRIETFVRRGGGLYSGSDNWPLQAESNQVTHRLYKKESFGNYEQVNAEASIDGNLDFSHIDSIPAGQTTTAFPMDYRLKVEAWVQDQPLISSGSLGDGKIIIDGGYSRFYCANRSDSSDALLNAFIVYLLAEGDN